ncbi:LCP family protein [Sharpea azabuensis]|uniref:Transcriptional attenuator, LytR family n=1 Tax=Sharpea azabuensis TaxID=322505 RepID=A0A1H6V555_9FIRM|nr:LCP family protein [Sharpea azabuensis]SEI95432.1 transcriptional attenuator, LytR family [Sharpea azabuensis]
MLKKILRRRNFLILQAITSIVLMIMVVRLGLVPTKYLIILGLVLVALELGMYVWLQPYKLRHHHDKKGKTRYLIGKIVSLGLSVLMVVGSLAVSKGNKSIDEMFNGNKEEITYSVVVLKNSSYKKLSDLNGKSIGIQPNVDTTNQNYILKEIAKKVTLSPTEYLNYQAVAQGLVNHSVECILLNEAYRTALAEYDSDFSKDTKVIWKYTLTQNVKPQTKSTNAAGTFIVYISGIDAYGTASTVSRSDVNMIVTVNTNTHNILMTSIPRDYYVPLANSGKEDKLTHSGLFGVENTVKTVENFMDIDIDYYARLNFTTLTELVDAIGGIDVYSDKDIKLLHGRELHEGVNHMDGATALAFARERYGYESGDYHRVQNQQDVLTAIIKKMLSPTLLTNYTKILDAAGGSFTTNMPADKMKEIASEQLSTNASWNFSSRIMEGTGKIMTGGYMMPNTKLYYTIPNENSVKQNKQYIKEVLSNDTINQ